MPTPIADRVKETSITVGLGTYALLGASLGFQTFNAAIGAGNTCYYTAEDGTNWEVGIGTVVFSPPQLQRTQILRSSNANAAVNWGAGTKTVFATMPGDRIADLVADHTPPNNPHYGLQWLDLVNNINFTYLFDGFLGNWVELGPEGIPDMADLFKMLSADDTGQNIATVQPWFPTAGAVTVQAATTYFCRGFLHLTRAAGGTSHTTSLQFGGTATLTSIKAMAFVNSGDVATNLAVNSTLIDVATALVVKAASTSTTEVIYLYVVGIIRINAGGSFIPQFTYSAIPGGVPTVKVNSFWNMIPVGTNTVTTQGLWS